MLVAADGISLSSSSAGSSHETGFAADDKAEQRRTTKTRLTERGAQSIIERWAAKKMQPGRRGGLDYADHSRKTVEV